MLKNDKQNNEYRELLKKNCETHLFSEDKSISWSIYNDPLLFLSRLLGSENTEDRTFSKQVLECLICVGDDILKFEAADFLFCNANEDNKAIARQVYRAAVQNPNHANFFNAAIKLWQGKLLAPANDQLSPIEEEDKTIARQAFQGVAHIPNHKDYFWVISELWRSNEEDKEITRPKLRQIAENMDHVNCCEAARMLLDGNEEDKKVACVGLHAIIQHPNHPKRFMAAYHLWNFTKIMQMILSYNNGARSWLATNGWAATNEHDKNLARSTLLDIIQNLNHEDAFYVGRDLWFENLVEAPRTNETFIQFTYASREEGKNIGNSIVRAIAATQNHTNQRDAIRLLRESNNAEDQRIGRGLQQQYFPAVWKPETLTRMAKINHHAIKATMPEPLEDLSVDPIDIVSEFDALMSMMSIHEKKIDYIPAKPSIVLTQTKKFSAFSLKKNLGKVVSVDNPYYLSPRAIDGDSNVTEDSCLKEKKDFLTNTRNHTIGFLKTLIGQELLLGKTTVWQMYDDDKPDMINSLKHIVRAITNQQAMAIDASDTDSIQNSMLSLGIVLNGILHCPTGQAEGIESAVNFLIRGNNIASTDVRGFFGKRIIASAMQKAFNKAFHHGGGGVHALARARTALKEVGFSYAINSFKERISTVDEEEIPEYYNAFYKVFTPHYIIMEARRNIQTAEESLLVTKASLGQANKQAAKAIKMNKPITVGQILEYLIDHGERDTLHDRFGISEDFRSISDAGLKQVLIKMEYLTDLAMV